MKTLHSSLSTLNFRTSAIAGTSNNTNAVELLSGDADLASVIAKINELINAQRR
jgi:hypothetical protein